MERKQIITFGLITMSVVAWHMVAMESKQEKMGLGQINEPAKGLKILAEPASTSVVQARNRNISGQVILETSDDLQTSVDINVARLFGFLDTIIDKRLKAERETLTFLGEIEISSEPSKLEVPIELRRITQPMLNEMLRAVRFTLQNFYPGSNAAAILSLPIETRREKLNSYMPPMPPPPLPIAEGRAGEIQRANVQRDNMRNMQEKLALLNAAYDLAMPELITYYALQTACLLLTTGVYLLNKGNYELLNFVLKEPVEIQNIITKYMEYRSNFGFRNIDIPKLESVNTIEKKVFLRLLTTHYIARPTPWDMSIWRSIDERDKELLRLDFAYNCYELDRQLKIGETKGRRSRSTDEK